MYTAIATPAESNIATAATTSDADTRQIVYGAGDYLTKNGHLYFITDYRPGGFIIENCETLCQHPIDFDFMHIGARWIARDKDYAKVLRYRKLTAGVAAKGGEDD